MKREQRAEKLSLFDSLDLLDPRAPLAARMRPNSLDELFGQQHLVGLDKPLRKAIEEDRVPSCILWGPPGCGKTTLAQIIAKITSAHFVQLSAVSSGVADLRREIASANQRGQDGGQRTVLFIDEIHRFNKAQQDAILPYVEDGTVTLIGATTENPSFEVIAPLLSRTRVYPLQPLDPVDLRRILNRALEDQRVGLGKTGVTIGPKGIDTLIQLSNGDARRALNHLELCLKSINLDDSTNGKTLELSVKSIEDIVDRQLTYDKNGESHYDIISAFIKSIRGSDPNAAIYWLARMVESGEQPLFIVRRLVILAAEDIGLADPQALEIAVAAQQAVHFVGMPEGYLILSEATLYLALAPKSNSALTSYQSALVDIKNHGSLPVPLHLRNAVTGLMASMGYGKRYQYAHNFNENIAPDQTYLPDKLIGTRYYNPSGTGNDQP